MTQTLLDNLGLVVALPFAIAALVWVVGRFSRALVPVVALVAPLAVLATGVSAILKTGSFEGYTGAYLTPPVAEGSFRWLLGSTEAIQMGWTVDGLTAIMLVVVGLVASMVVIFSIGYMAEDSGYTRYFALLALFTGSMTVLVVADGLVGLFVGWELVGACSYLLIGFWFTKPSAAAAAIKAFITTRVGDLGLLLGIGILWQTVGRLSYTDVFSAVDALSPATVTLVAILLFVGAMGKSAQFPLHIWLPEAMEGPTPVSALIHAATMVAAGVFLVARVWPLFEASPEARLVVLVVGAFTALAAATVAVAQTDIKKVLAYSTISQLGFMFAALGAGAWVAAVFHLVTHAGFKALLFLGSGSVIHGTGTQDMREMGGLRKYMGVTTFTWIVGSLALAGVPLFAGFFSKDEVIHGVLSASPIAGGALVLASLLTAFYITRATRMTFFGEYRGTGHPHEGGWSMKGPLLVLAVPAVFAGFAGHKIAALLGEHAEALDPTTAAISIGVALLGIAGGWYLYRDGAESEAEMESRFSGVWPVLRSAYRFDPAVDAVIVRPTLAASTWLYEMLDRGVIDPLAEGVGGFARWLGSGVSRVQYGDTQWYVSLIGAGTVLILAIAVVDWAALWTRILSIVGVG